MTRNLRGRLERLEKHAPPPPEEGIDAFSLMQTALAAADLSNAEFARWLADRPENVGRQWRQYREALARAEAAPTPTLDVTNTDQRSPQGNCNNE